MMTYSLYYELRITVLPGLIRTILEAYLSAFKLFFDAINCCLGCAEDIVSYLFKKEAV